MDIKTQKKENFEIKSIDDGFVKRIKIAHGGFGKVLYVEHPNGYTSVYAHLKKICACNRKLCSKTTIPSGKL